MRSQSTRPMAMDSATARCSIDDFATRFVRSALCAAALLVVACSSDQPVTYGSPGNLNEAKLPGEAGVAPLSCDGGITGDDAAGDDGGACAVSWTKDLYPKMTATGMGAWGCATANCHAVAGNGPVIDPKDPVKALKSLEAYRLMSKPGTPYVSTSKDPSQSTMECNVSGGCSPAMPQAPFVPLSDADRCALDAWLRCGAPGN